MESLPVIHQTKPFPWIDKLWAVQACQAYYPFRRGGVRPGAPRTLHLGATVPGTDLMGTWISSGNDQQFAIENGPLVVDLSTEDGDFSNKSSFYSSFKTWQGRGMA